MGGNRLAGRDLQAQRGRSVDLPNKPTHQACRRLATSAHRRTYALALGADTRLIIGKGHGATLTLNEAETTALQAAMAQISSPCVSFLDMAGFLNITYGLDLNRSHPTEANEPKFVAPSVTAGMLPILQPVEASRSCRPLP